MIFIFSDYPEIKYDHVYRNHQNYRGEVLVFYETKERDIINNYSNLEKTFESLKFNVRPFVNPTDVLATLDEGKLNVYLFIY